MGGKIKTINDYKTISGKDGAKWIGDTMPEKAHHRTKWQCAKGHIWEARYNDISQGKGCPYCSKNAPKTIDDYCNINRDGIKWIGDALPKNTVTKTKWQCKNKHIWTTSYNTLVNFSTGCPYCAGLNRRTIEHYKNADTKDGIKWAGKELPKNTEALTEWRCINGHIWKASYRNVTGIKTGCPHCYQSEGEKIIAKTLKKLNILYISQKWIQGYRFDFYCAMPDKKLLIEYDGIQHFKPIDFCGKGMDWAEKEFLATQKRDAIKTDLANQLGYILIRIPYTAKDTESELVQKIQATCGPLEGPLLYIQGKLF